MSYILKKLNVRCVSLSLGIILFTNNVFAMEPRINESALILAFRDQYSRNGKIKNEALKDVTGFCTNPSGDELPLCYVQKAGTYKEENREVYVWNLPGVVDPGVGFAGILLRYMNRTVWRLKHGDIQFYIEMGKACKGVGQLSLKGGFGSGVAFEVVKKSAEFFEVTPETIISAFKQGMNVLGIKDSCKYAEILSKGFNKVSSKFSSGSKLFVGLQYGAVVFGTLAIAVGAILTMEGVAKLNEEARNVADAETIVSIFLELVFRKKYHGANILVMAKDVSTLHFYNYDKRGEMPFVGFWKHEGLSKYGAPIFYSPWPNPEIPSWACAFVENLGDRGDVRKALEDATESLNDVKKSLGDTAKLCSVSSDKSGHLIEWVK